MSLTTTPSTAFSTNRAEQSTDVIITIPQQINIGELRDDFLDLCEDMNLDASIEAARS